jgi:hypothetical protein
MLAEKTGATGVQKNAAVPEQATEVDYWAIVAGDGARLDGKQPAPLKDASGNALDVSKLRAAAAQKRAEAAAAALPTTAGISLTGETVETTTTPAGSVLPVSKRKKRVGGRFSKLKTNSAAFQGSSNKIDDK